MLDALARLYLAEPRRVRVFERRVEARLQRCIFNVIDSLEQLKLLEYEHLVICHIRVVEPSLLSMPLQLHDGQRSTDLGEARETRLNAVFATYRQRVTNCERHVVQRFAHFDGAPEADNLESFRFVGFVLGCPLVDLVLIEVRGKLTLVRLDTHTIVLMHAIAVTLADPSVG